MSETLRTIGASIALVTRTELGRCVLAVRRTDDAHIPYPGQWEFPGGGAEPGEPALACAQREFHEETGIWIPEAAVVWRALYPSRRLPGNNAFFVAQVPHDVIPPLHLSDEAQAGDLMPVDDFLARTDAVPGHVARFEDYEQGQNGIYLRHRSELDLAA